MTITLYETTDAIAQVIAWLEESEGEWTPEIEALMSEAEGNFTAKAERVALVVRDRLALAKANEEAAAHHAKRAQSFTKAANGLKAYLQREMERAGKNKVDAPLVTISIQNNPEKVVAPEWDEEALRGMAVVAPQFVTQKPATFALNKAAILTAHKNGQPIPEGVTIERSTRLSIR